MALTVKKISRLRSARGKFADGFGLYLQVVNAQNASWLFRYKRFGRTRWMGLGPLHTFSLDEARELARKSRQQIREGVDPLEQRRAQQQAEKLAAAKTKTFKDCAEDYFAFHADKWKRGKSRRDFTGSLTSYVYPKIGHLPVAGIDTGMVLKCVEPIWKTKTTTASRIRSRIESILDWATVRGYRVGANPARWDGHLAHILPAAKQIAKVAHHAAMPYGEINAFMTALQAQQGVAARALEFLVLTATRTMETVGARWEEIDLAEKVWTIPQARMKKGQRDHRVPLCPRALELLRGLPRLNDHVFPAGRKDVARIAPNALARLFKGMGYTVTVHGFRSTFRDWAAETTGYPNEVVEMALAHTIKNKSEAAYRRGDLFIKRTRLMDEWATYCASPPAAVMPMRRRA